jgi:glucosylceramidase
MHFSPEECADFVKNHLGPQLKKDGLDIHILVYDQNRGVDLERWSEVLLNDKELLPYIYGTAVHWYSSTYKYFPESLNFTHELAPDKHIINTEACIDNDIPRWKEDDWYWKKEATDWGYQWALEENKPNHPPYVPVYRYARDIIGCLNNWVEGWIDWNMVLDVNGGPNLASNWCIAPVIVDVDKNEIYYTPLYYTLSHFSKFIRPGAKRIAFENTDASLMTTAVLNPDGSIVLIVLNMTEEEKSFEVKLKDQSTKVKIDKQALQTIVFSKNTIERKN